MLIHPQFDPIAFSIGPVSVHWYGLMYLVGFALFWILAMYRSKKDAWRAVKPNQVEDLLFVGVLGVILGGRLGYCFLYQPGYYIEHLGAVFRIWDGGMSAHGGVIGVIVAMAYFAKTRHLKFLDVADFVTPMVPLGLFFGRIGNFINGELWGRICSPDFALAMIFPRAGDGLPRHPSQLYEATLEGWLLFVDSSIIEKEEKYILDKLLLFTPSVKIDEKRNNELNHIALIIIDRIHNINNNQIKTTVKMLTKTFISIIADFLLICS